MPNKNKEYLDEKPRSRLVCKANDLVEAKYRLTVQEQKLVIMAIAKINPTKPDFENPYRLSIDEVAKACGIEKTGIYQKVASTVDRLMTRLVKIKNDDGHSVVHWISEARYYTGMGHFDLWFHEKMRPYLLELKEYVSYDQNQVLQFQSSYSFRIYEILKKWDGANKGNQFSVKVEQLKDVLGIRKTEYQLFGNFNKGVLKKAQSELTQESDLTFTYTTWKEGRAVAGIVFTIKDNKATGKPKKCKRGRPKKVDQSIQATADIGDLLNEDSVYSLPLTRKLEAAGVRHLQKYKDDGVTEEDFEQSLALRSEAREIVEKSLEIRNIRLGRSQKRDIDIGQKTIIKRNKDFVIANQKDYDFEVAILRIEDSYFQHKKGVFKFADPDFIEKVEVLNWENLRSKIQLSGSGEKRSKERT
jgi:plasmid replication initiation protein